MKLLKTNALFQEINGWNKQTGLPVEHKSTPVWVITPKHTKGAVRFFLNKKINPAEPTDIRIWNDLHGCFELADINWHFLEAPPPSPSILHAVRALWTLRVLSL